MRSVQILGSPPGGSLLETGLAGRPDQAVDFFQKGNPLPSFTLCKLSQRTQTGWSQRPWEVDLGRGTCGHSSLGMRYLVSEEGPQLEPEGRGSSRLKALG